MRWRGAVQRWSRRSASHRPGGPQLLKAQRPLVFFLSAHGSLVVSRRRRSLVIFEASPRTNLQTRRRARFSFLGQFLFPLPQSPTLSAPLAALLHLDLRFLLLLLFLVSAVEPREPASRCGDSPRRSAFPTPLTFPRCHNVPNPYLCATGRVMAD